MPANKVLIGVDLDKIKPIPGAITFTADITTVACRNELNKLTNGQLADVVLHDGAPNVGGVWARDAYGQSELVLHSLRLATEFLAHGGTFVTKVFRSADYNNLLWVFNTLFKRVTATKPVASRNTSAEIFVVCENFLRPKKLDPRLLDPKYVFQEIHQAKVLDVFAKKVPKPNKEGYEDEDTQKGLLYKELDILDFIYSNDPVNIVFRDCPPADWVQRDRDSEDDAEERELLLSHPSTNVEIKECLSDLKVLNAKDFKGLLKWRVTLREFAQGDEEKETNEEEQVPAIELTEEQQQNLLQQELDDKVKQMARLRKKRLAKRRKQQSKFQMRMGLATNMGNEEFEAPTETSLFGLATVKTGGTLESLLGVRASHEASAGELVGEISFGDSDSCDDEFSAEEEDEEAKRTRRAEAKLMEDEFEFRKAQETTGIPDYYDESSESSDDEEEDGQQKLSKRDKKVEQALDMMYERMRQEREQNIKRSVRQRRIDEKREAQAQNLQDFSAYHSDEEDSENEDASDLEDPNELLAKKDDKVSAKHKVAMWFGKDAFEGLEEDGEEDKAIEVMLKERQNRKKRKLEETNKNESDKEHKENDDVQPRKKQKTENEKKKPTKADSDDEEESRKKVDFEVVPSDLPDFDGYDSEERAEMLAMGKKLMDKKKRSEVIDASFNRYSFNDVGVSLPSWFLDDENAHNQPQVPVTKEEVLEHKRWMREIDARSTKKVAEAKARKKKQYTAKLEKAKRKARSISEASELSEREKIKAIQKLYKGQLKDEKREKVYVVARKYGTAKLGRSGGKNVRVKVVDPRMKKDKRGAKAKANKGKKGRR